MTRILFLLAPVCLVCPTLSAFSGEPKGPSLKLSGEVAKIWDKGNHNAFTDLLRYEDKWYCVFREGTGHASGTGKIRVLVSDDGKAWQSAALIEKKDTDLRDSHLCITPDGRLMINGGAAFPYTRDPVTNHFSFVSFSKDGTTWTEPVQVLDDWKWLWRVTWHKGTAYGVAYEWSRDEKAPKTYKGGLYQSKDGLKWDKLTDFDIPQTTEATVRFDGDTLLILQRRDGKPNTAMLGTSEAPYTKVTWKDLGFYYGGPNFIQGPDGVWWTSGRIIKDGAKTVLGRLDVKTAKLEALLTLPSGGDNSYAGMVWSGGGELWVSYYSTHEGKTSIYVAKAVKEYPELPKNKTKPPGKAPQGMVWVPGGWFWMGGDDVSHEMSGPVHKVYVDGLWMDQTEATNAMWAEFVKETGYKTVAEWKPDPFLFPNVDPGVFKDVKPFSAVFTPPENPVKGLDNHLQWWKGVEGADWAHPEGPDSNIKTRMDHPVTHISWVDAALYCNWRSFQAKRQPCYDLQLRLTKEKAEPLTLADAFKLKEDQQARIEIVIPKDVLKRTGYRLPTEAEWEFAARGGMNQKKFAWGDELQPGGKWMANIWQGSFPHKNTRQDGHDHTAPVKSFSPNGYGLYDLAGNVWEWCQDWYQPDYYANSPETNPPGPPTGFDPNEPGEAKRVQRGGSFLCHESYCERYLTYARGKGEITSSANHIGSRCVRGVTISQVGKEPTKGINP